MTHATTIRTGLPSRMTALLLAAVTALSVLTAAGGAGATEPATRRVIVEAVGGLDAAGAAVTAVGGQVHRALTAFGLLVADVPAASLDALDRDARTGPVTPDRPLQVQSDAFEAVEAPASALQTVGAPAAWSAGATGAGVGIAVVDTGIDEHPDLAGRVVASFDLSGESTPDDGYGHGTFLAGLAAGDGTASGGRYPGAAPGAHLVSIKVAGADGATTLSTVLNGLVVIERTAADLGVRVVMLALSGPAGPTRDPLQTALERLWDRGLFVVVAAGNTGPDAGSVGSPGVSPTLLTLGATDDAGTGVLDDDVVPGWSSRGPTAAGAQKPELVAPGTRVVAARAVGSAVDEAFPNARIGEHYLRGSGTSMATALAAGAAAVTLQAHPDLTPDRLKAHLAGTAAALPAVEDATAIGSGSLDLAAAVATAPSVHDAPAPPPGHAGTPPPAAGREAADKDAAAPAGWRWADGELAGWRWAGGEWSGWRWAGDDWSGWRWAGDQWSGWRWADGEWSGWRWAGDDWSGWRWAGDEWSGWRWAGDDWSGWRWAGFVGNADATG